MAMQVQKFLHFVVENVVFLLGEFARFDAVNDEHQMFDEVAGARDQTRAEKHFHSEIEFADVFFFRSERNSIKSELFFFFELDLSTFGACRAEKGLKAKASEEER